MKRMEPISMDGDGAPASPSAVMLETLLHVPAAIVRKQQRPVRLGRTGRLNQDRVVGIT